MANRTTISKIRSRISNRLSFKVGCYLAATGVVLFLSSLLFPSFSMLDNADKVRIEYSISSKVNQLNQLSAMWLKDSISTHKHGFSILNASTIDLLKKEGLAVYLLSNNKVAAWSSIPSFNENLQNSIDSTLKLCHLNDGFYLATKIKKGNKSVIYTIEVQKKFQISNNFLKDNFNPLFNIPKNATLDTSKQAKYDKPHSFIIHYKNSPLFTLSQKGTHSNSPSKEAAYYIALLLFIIGTWNILIAIPFGRRTSSFFLVLMGWMLLCSILGILLSQKETNMLLFSPALYSSILVPSLGLLFVYVLIGCTAASTVYYHFVSYKILSLKRAYRAAAAHSLVVASCNVLLYRIIFSLVNNSTISFGITRIVELSRYSIIIYIIIALSIIGILLLINLYSRLYKDIPSIKKQLILWVPLVLATVILSFDNPIGYLTIAATAITAYLFGHQAKKHQRISIGFLSLIIVIWAITTSITICHFITIRDTYNKIAFAESLYNENDPILESTIPDLYQKLKSDTTITRLVSNPQKNEQELNRYIKTTYMNGYISKYNLLLTICPENAQLMLPQEKRTTDCRKYFETLFLQLGSQVPNSNFFYIRNYPGQLTYIGDLKYFVNGKATSLFVELDVKTINNNPGYPELLIKDSQQRNNDYRLYDYALYINGKLMAKNGDYSFPSIITPPSIKQKYYTKLANGYSHLYYRLDEQNTLVVSRQKLRIFDIASSFSYIFILLAFFSLILLRRSHFPLDDSLSYKTFKGKITLSFVIILTTALALAAIGSLAYGIIRFDNMKEKIIQDKMKSAIPAVRTAYNYIDKPDMTDELIKVSNYLYVDVNLYDKDGTLIATSRPEIFFEGLQGYKMSPKAYQQLVLNYEGFFVDQENIGAMTYTSSYSPIFNNDGNLLGYVNLPYFQEYNELKNEIYTIAIATANIFILLLLPVVFIGILISKSITRPLAQIQSRMRFFDLKKNLEPIPYNRNDEIGDLITEFNKMVVQVKQSAEKLADSERDSAWREMARQIAHEIKNPLTPMKLSLQYLIMLKNKKDSRWEEQFDRYATSQIEQIDSLAKIATEFSDFAKINFDEHTPNFDIRELVNEVIPIFDGFKDLKINLDLTNETCLIQADKEHIKRVFVNLLKNATQSFDMQDHPQIDIKVECKDGKVLLFIKDNGKGVPEELKNKLFVPNFTTKSSGSGLGLPISRNLVEAYHGKIWFTSELYKGTTFYIEFPLAKKQQK